MGPIITLASSSNVYEFQTCVTHEKQYCTRQCWCCGRIHERHVSSVIHNTEVLQLALVFCGHQRWSGEESKDKEQPQSPVLKTAGTRAFCKGRTADPAADWDHPLKNRSKPGPGLWFDRANHCVGGPLGRGFWGEAQQIWSGQRMSASSWRARFLPKEIGVQGLCSPNLYLENPGTLVIKREKWEGPSAAPHTRRKDLKVFRLRRGEQRGQSWEFTIWTSALTWSAKAGSPEGGCMMLKDHTGIITGHVSRSIM